MKKIMFTLIALLTIATSARAMSYEQARNEALFLTDKMAYELNLSDAQYEAAYEINLDYLMGVTSRDDVFGIYWERRNRDLNYILHAWQWDLFYAATYFYRPLYWNAGYWHFGIYARYPRRDYFYFGRPHFYATYRGGHSWHHYHDHGYYASHRDHYRPNIARDHHTGMRDSWNRGDYKNNRINSSTRMTSQNNRPNDNNRLNDNNRNQMNNNRQDRMSNSGNFSGIRNNSSTRTESNTSKTESFRSNPTRSGSISNSTSSRSIGSGSHGGGMRSSGSTSSSMSRSSSSMSRSSSSMSRSSIGSTRSSSVGGGHSSGGSRSVGSSSRGGGRR